jgi:hypothetical protein
VRGTCVSVDDEGARVERLLRHEGGGRESDEYGLGRGGVVEGQRRQRELELGVGDQGELRRRVEGREMAVPREGLGGGGEVGGAAGEDVGGGGGVERVGGVGEEGEEAVADEGEAQRVRGRLELRTIGWCKIGV